MKCKLRNAEKYLYNIRTRVSWPQQVPSLVISILPSHLSVRDRKHLWSIVIDGSLVESCIARACKISNSFKGSNNVKTMFSFCSKFLMVMCIEYLTIVRKVYNVSDYFSGQVHD